MKFSVLFQYWWLLIVAVCASTSIGMLYTYSQPYIYEAKSAFIINPSGDFTNVRDHINSLDTLTGRTSISTTYCGLIESQSAFRQTLNALSVSAETAANYTVTCTVKPNSNILQIRVQGESPTLARDIAQIIGFSQLDGAIGVQELFDLQLVDPAVVDEEPVSPSHDLNIIAAALVGLFGGILAILLFSTLSSLRQTASNSRETAADAVVLSEAPASTSERTSFSETVSAIIDSHPVTAD